MLPPRSVHVGVVVVATDWSADGHHRGLPDCPHPAAAHGRTGGTAGMARPSASWASPGAGNTSARPGGDRRREPAAVHRDPEPVADRATVTGVRAGPS